MASLAQYVSQIQNHLSGGLRGQGNYTYSLEQIADEFIQKRGEVLCWLEKQGTPDALTSAAQRMDGLILKPADWLGITAQGQQLLSNLPVPASRLAWHHCKVPRLLDLKMNPVIYLGPAGRPETWNVVRTPDELEHQEHRRLTRRAPLCYIENEDLWVTGRDGRLPQVLRMISVCADPRDAFRMGLDTQEHKLREDVNVDQTDDKRPPLPKLPIGEESAEKARLRVLNLFLGTHGTRPIVPNNGTAII